MVEFGTSKMSAHPFMLPAAEAERGPYASRLRQAGQQAGPVKCGHLQYRDVFNGVHRDAGFGRNGKGFHFYP